MPSAAALAFLAVASAAAPGAANDDAACKQFDWSVERELKLFQDPDLETVFSGATLGSLPQKGLALELEPQFAVEYVIPPGEAPKSDAAFGGLLFIKSVPQAGDYQVTLSEDVWADLIQDGKALPLSAETLNANCSDAPKSMRFHLGPGPLTVQITGAGSSRIKLAILPPTKS